MTANEHRLLDRAERLRRRMIEVESWLKAGNVERAKAILARTLSEDG